MIHMHSMFSSETNTSAAGKSSDTPLGHAALKQANLDSFHGALSDAVSSTLEKFGIHPNDVKISITRANADPAPPASASSGAPTRTAPPTPGTAPSTSGSSGAATGAPNGGYDPFLQ